MTNNQPLTVFLAGGQSKRFAAAGWVKHKSLLPMPDNRVLLEWSFENIPTQEVLFVALKEYGASLMPKIYNIHRQNKSIEEIKHAWIKKATSSPLETLWSLRSFLDYEREILIHFCDVITPPDLLEWFLVTAQGSEGNSALIGTEYAGERLTLVKDYDLADCGIYWFRHGNDLVDAMERERKRLEKPAIYDLVYSLKNWGVYATPEVVDLGVPEEYFNWMAEQGTPMDKKKWQKTNQPI